MRSSAVVALGLIFALPVRAGIYSSNEPFLFELDADGFARPIQFSGGFNSFLSDMRQIAMIQPNPETPDNKKRAEAKKRVQALQSQGMSNLSPEELAAFTADLIRLNRNEEALNILQPLARDPRRGGFLAYAHLAKAHAGRGEWREAFEQEQMAVRYTDFPTAFAKLTKPQLAWLKRVEREYYLPFLAHRAEESRRGRPGDLREDVDALFPTTPPPRHPESPVHFVGEDGKYAAGTIAKAEQKKLPPDALAIVQQLVLWHPQDARLFWLLGELYNADGDVETAAGILEECTFTMGYSNPTIIDHRRILKPVADQMATARNEQAKRVREREQEEIERQAKADRDEQERQAQAERDYRKRFWWILSVGVALGLMLIYYQFREVIRRIRRSS